MDIQEIIHFQHKIRLLKDLVRGSNNPFIHKKDTVGSHSWRAALLSLQLMEYFEKKSLNTQKITNMLLIHDLVELGNSEVKAVGHRDRKEKATHESEIANSLFTPYEGSWSIVLKSLLDEFMAQKTLESKIAKCLENYESNLHVIEEIDPVRDPDHKRITIDYIKRRIGILPILDELIKNQLEEIEQVSRYMK